MNIEPLVKLVEKADKDFQLALVPAGIVMQFAELIVQECTEIAQEIAFKHQVKEDTYSAGKKAGAFEVAEGIKQHFGVE